MIISGHQPCYLPWLGYFHKLSLCDTFVYMDTVQYLENDWNNRNKVRTPQGWHWLTVPLDRKKTQGKKLSQIIIRGHDNPNMKDFWQKIHWRTIEVNYIKTPYFHLYQEELRAMYLEKVWVNLVDLCWHQFKLFSKWLNLDHKKIVRMSEMEFEGEKDFLVLDHCLKLKGDQVVFGKHGRDYVNSSIFFEKGIKIYFQNYKHPKYKQRFRGFEPFMGIIDLLFNHGSDCFEILQSGNISYNNLLEQKYWEEK
tara:strand:- start:618 stop:1373 length:756 start_codon:yes stop_codon:yes gene_type:complete